MMMLVGRIRNFEQVRWESSREKKAADAIGRLPEVVVDFVEEQ